MLREQSLAQDTQSQPRSIPGAEKGLLICPGMDQKARVLLQPSSARPFSVVPTVPDPGQFPGQLAGEEGAEEAWPLFSRQGFLASPFLLPGSALCSGMTGSLLFHSGKATRSFLSLQPLYVCACVSV